MKTPLKIVGILTLVAVISSCSSFRPIMDDNVYMLKTAAVPMGENLLDETSYATYKYREDMNNPTTGYYNPMNESIRNNNGSIYYVPSYFYFGMMFPIYNVSGFGNYMSINSHTNYNPYGFNHFAGFNGYSSYYTNPYLGYYPTYGGYGNYYNSGFMTSSSFSSTNQGIVTNGNHRVSGPRATFSGYYSGVSRGGTQQLKSQVPNSSGNSNYSNEIIGSPKQEMRRTGSLRNGSATNKLHYSNRGGANQVHGEATKYNNQQARSVQSRVNTSNRVSISTSNSSQSRSKTVNSPSRNSNIGSPVQRSNSGTTATPSRSSSSSSGGRRN
jgi:hypothetical protein